MAILIFALIAVSLYFRIAKFDAHNFTITICVSVFTFLFLGIAVLNTDYQIAQSTLSIIVEKLSNSQLNVTRDHMFYVFAVGYEIVILFALLTFMRFVLDLSHTVSLLISGLVLAVFNAIAMGVITGNIQTYLQTDSGVIAGWFILILLTATLVAILGPVLTTINLVVLVAIYGYQVNAIAHIAQYFQVENMVGLVGIEKVVMMVIVTAVIASIDTLKSMVD
ncbi:MAG: hypothetical protein ACRBBN_06050 [Methyloligellaceae bacterium]